MACFPISSGDGSELPSKEAKAHMRDMFGPTAVDSAIRSAISVCWMSLPDDKRNLQEVERQLRRILDRALENAKEDGAAFGISEPT